MCRGGRSCERNWKRGASRDESSAASVMTRPAISGSWSNSASSYFCQPSFLPRLDRDLLLRATLFQHQETVGQHHQAGVVMEPTPRAALEMIQAQFFLHLLVALLHRPAALPEPNRLDSAGPRREVRELMLTLAAAPPRE